MPTITTGGGTFESLSEAGNPPMSGWVVGHYNTSGRKLRDGRSTAATLNLAPRPAVDMDELRRIVKEEILHEQQAQAKVRVEVEERRMDTDL
jgi:hypothetical protein